MQQTSQPHGMLPIGRHQFNQLNSAGIGLRQQHATTVRVPHTHNGVQAAQQVVLQPQAQRIVASAATTIKPIESLGLQQPPAAGLLPIDAACFASLTAAGGAGSLQRYFPVQQQQPTSRDAAQRHVAAPKQSSKSADDSSSPEGNVMQGLLSSLQQHLQESQQPFDHCNPDNSFVDIADGPAFSSGGLDAAEEAAAAINSAGHNSDDLLAAPYTATVHVAAPQDARSHKTPDDHTTQQWHILPNSAALSNNSNVQLQYPADAPAEPARRLQPSSYMPAAAIQGANANTSNGRMQPVTARGSPPTAAPASAAGKTLRAAAQQHEQEPVPAVCAVGQPIINQLPPSRNSEPTTRLPIRAIISQAAGILQSQSSAAAAAAATGPKSAHVTTAADTAPQHCQQPASEAAAPSKKSVNRRGLDLSCSSLGGADHVMMTMAFLEGLGSVLNAAGPKVTNATSTATRTLTQGAHVRLAAGSAAGCASIPSSRRCSRLGLDLSGSPPHSTSAAGPLHPTGVVTGAPGPRYAATTLQPQQPKSQKEQKHATATKAGGQGSARLTSKKIRTDNAVDGHDALAAAAALRRAASSSGIRDSCVSDQCAKEVLQPSVVEAKHQPITHSAVAVPATGHSGASPCKQLAASRLPATIEAQQPGKAHCHAAANDLAASTAHVSASVEDLYEQPPPTSAEHEVPNLAEPQTVTPASQPVPQHETTATAGSSACNAPPPAATGGSHVHLASLDLDQPEHPAVLNQDTMGRESTAWTGCRAAASTAAGNQCTAGHQLIVLP